MSKRFLALNVLAVALVTASASPGWGRGFGGGGFHGGDFGGGRGDFGGYRGDDFGGMRDYGGDRFGADRFGAEGDRFNAAAYGADRFDADRAAGYADPGRAAAAPTRGDVNRFLGLPSDEGFHQLTGAAANNAARATGGGWNRPGDAAGRWTPAQRQAWGNNVRNNFNHWDAYGAGWYQNHPDAWLATGWGAGAAWNVATWPAVGAWFGSFGGYGGYGTGPIDYNYGGNIVYQNNDVYMDGQDVDTAAQYYNQVADQADGGAEANANENQPWLPLGVFALAQGEGQQSSSLVQLAVNKQGIIRGNYTDTVSDTTSPIQGSIDEKTQRVAWTVGDNQTTVLEAGLYNLTQPEAPVLIHFGAEKAQQWLLVRLDKNQAQTGAAPQPGPAAN
ncbi:MAG TPA: hypothetical protein VHY91_15265 [Pirellulales bacterium]|jgi:hypothetical protein|nr:hypothetical protein [Pirellulales bacterium]